MAGNKLTCVTHGRRVYVIPVPDKNAVATHRSGNQERCSSPTFSIGGRTYTANEIAGKMHQQSDPAIDLLREIFADPNHTPFTVTSSVDPRKPALRVV